MRNRTFIITIGVFAAICLGLIGKLILNKQSSVQVNQTATTEPPAGQYANQIKNNSTTPGLVIKSLTVENNVDSNGQPASDHIEVSIENTSGSTMKSLESYVTMTDQKTGSKEGYFVPLTGLSLMPNQTVTVHYNGGSGNNHYALTHNSMYYKSADAITVSVQISLPGFATQTQSVTKSPGGAETKD